MEKNSSKQQWDDPILVPPEEQSGKDEFTAKLNASEKHQSIKIKGQTYDLARWLTLGIVASICLLLIASVFVGLFSGRDTSDVSGLFLQILQPALFTLLGFLFGKHITDKS